MLLGNYVRLRRSHYFRNFQLNRKGSLMRTVELMVSVLLLFDDEAVVHNIVCVLVHGLICGRIRAHYCLLFHISPGSNVSSKY
jgi:hypothetical protein